MTRIADTLDRIRRAGGKALIPYITAGDPHPRHTVALMHALVQAGADVIELGVPFSDPMADGPVIQLACERALKHGTSLWDVIDMVAEFRETDASTPVVLMGYMNPIETRGVTAFAQRAQAAGVDGVLIVDLAAEEAGEIAAAIKQHGLDCIFLLAPTTSEPRIRAIAEQASGYLYYVSLKGVTGAAKLDVADVRERIQVIRRCTQLPIAVGFGVRDGETARAVAQVADAVVVGSALVAEIEQHAAAPDLPARLGAKLKPMREALNK